jgi:hypothetical protein
MNTTARALAGLTVASAAVTVALAGPASATPWGPMDQPGGEQPTGGHGVHGHAAAATSSSGTPAPQTSTVVPDDPNVDWAQVAYGAAGGIAMTTAAGATLILVRRRQHLAHQG